MNEEHDLHAPSDAFRASLESMITQTYREQSRFSISSMPSRFAQMRTAAALAVGLLLGAGTGIASAQVKEAKQREEWLSTIEASLELAGFRVNLAKSSLALTQKRVDAGAAARDVLYGSMLEVQTAELNLARLAIDLEESKLTAQSPRDELWAPLVKGRDFVKERLMIDARLAQIRADDVRRMKSDDEVRASAGAPRDVYILEGQLGFLKNSRDMELASKRLSLRAKFLKEHTAPELIARELQTLAVRNALENSEMGLQLAQRRMSLLRQRVQVGADAAIDLKRAELDVLERKVELDRLKFELQAFDGSKKRSPNP